MGSHGQWAYGYYMNRLGIRIISTMKYTQAHSRKCLFMGCFSQQALCQLKNRQFLMLTVIIQFINHSRYNFYGVNKGVNP